MDKQTKETDDKLESAERTVKISAYILIWLAGAYVTLSSFFLSLFLIAYVIGEEAYPMVTLLILVLRLFAACYILLFVIIIIIKLMRVINKNQQSFREKRKQERNELIDEIVNRINHDKRRRN